MRRTFTLLTLALILFGAASASASDMSKDEIAKLPQDKVQIIKADCARKWGDNFEMRIFCEDTQYRALEVLIERDR